MDPGPMLSIIILVVLVLVNAFFAASEIAVISLNDSQIEKEAESGGKKAKILLRFIQDPTKFLATIQVGITLSGFLASAFAADRFAPVIGSWAAGFIPLPTGVLTTIALIVITLLLSFFTLVFGELVPKRLAMQNPEKLSKAFARPLSFIYQCTRPFAFVLSKSTNGILRIFGIKPDSEPQHVTEEEIRMMVDVGNEKGVIEESQREMINNIFEFDDTTADEIMTHRTEVLAVDIHCSISQVIAQALEEGFSRIPVYENDIDNIVGIIYVKDFLRLVDTTQSDTLELKDFLHPALFVPETNDCKELFKELTEKKIQMAVVVDEYGGTSGIVTMEDVLESIVGNIQDEYDNEEEEISQISENIYSLDGGADLEEVFDLLGLKVPEDSDYDTIGGFIIGLLGRIPDDGETPSLEYENVHFQVEDIEERRIVHLTAEILPVPESGQEDDE